MRIAGMTIAGFGRFRESTIHALSPTVTVFEGPNEAGKTTLMAFMRAMLFGFEGRRHGINRYAPTQGGRHGGALIVDTADGRRFRIERFDSTSRGQVNVSELVPFPHNVSEANPTQHDEDVLQQLLYGTSKLLYHHVFAFGLGELERLETLQAEEVSQHIYTVGMGIGLTPLTIVQNGLETEQSKIFKPGGRKPFINQLLHRLEKSQSAIRDLQTLPDEHDTLYKQLHNLDQEIREDHKKLEETKMRCDWLESLMNARSDWEQRHVVCQELHDLPTIERFPAGGIERLEQAERALESVGTRLDAIRSTLRQAVERQVMVRPDPQVLTHQQSIERLEDQRGQYKSMLESLPNLRSSVAVGRNVLDDMLRHLGPAWDDARLDRFEASISIRERVRGLRDRLEACQQDVIKAHGAYDDAERLKQEKEGALKRLQEQFEQLTDPERSTGVALDERARALQQWVQLHHQRDVTQQRRLDLQAQTAACEAQIQTTTNEWVSTKPHSSWWALIGVSAVFIGLGMYAGTQQDVSLMIVSAAAGLLVVGLVFWWRHAAGAQRHNLKNRGQTLTQQEEALQEEVMRAEHVEQGLIEEMTRLSQEVLGVTLTSLDEAESTRRVLEAERRVAERREEMNRRIQDEEEAFVRAVEQDKAALHVRETVESTQDRATQDWHALLSSLGLPEDLTPDGALEVIAGAERAQRQLREWREVVRECQHAERFVEDTAKRLNHVLEQCGHTTVDVAHSLGAWATLRKALEQSLAHQQEMVRLTELIAERQAELETVESEQVRSVDQLQALLHAGGAADRETFRQRAGLYTRQVELEQQQRQLDYALTVHAGSVERYQDMDHALSHKSRVELEQEWSEAKREGQQSLAEELRRKLQQKGRLEQRLQDLEHNEELSVVLLERQALLAQLTQQATQWAVCTLCQHFLDQARHVYERERQPAVLREASKFFAVMTGGQYLRVNVPLGEMRLEVEADDGTSLPTDRLSRGTAEQLYLAMRLAFIREYAKHAGPLPLIIDDILVNFDPERAKATIAVLGEISMTHQVLVFTCHPHVSRWFEQTLEGVSIRPMHNIS